MTFYFQVAILASFLSIFVYSYAMNRHKTREMESEARNNQIADLTKGLTDSEIKMALNDLSLADLNALSKLIDASNVVDYDYDEESFLNSNMRLGPFYPVVLNSDINAGDSDDMIYEDITADDMRNREGDENLGRFDTPKRSILNSGEIQRPKRENPKNHEQFSVDEEYLKQLENSFPRDQDQNDHEETGNKKDHIRIKRN